MNENDLDPMIVEEASSRLNAVLSNLEFISNTPDTPDAPDTNEAPQTVFRLFGGPARIIELVENIEEFQTQSRPDDYYELTSDQESALKDQCISTTICAQEIYKTSKIPYDQQGWESRVIHVPTIYPKLKRRLPNQRQRSAVKKERKDEEARLKKQYQEFKKNKYSPYAKFQKKYKKNQVAT